MKTFDEAMQMRNCRTQEEWQAGFESLKRYESLIREIAESAETRSFVMAFLESPMPDDMAEPSRLLSLLVSVFANGVMVGIEMEKSE